MHHTSNPRARRVLLVWLVGAAVLLAARVELMSPAPAFGQTAPQLSPSATASPSGPPPPTPTPTVATTSPQSTPTHTASPLSPTPSPTGPPTSATPTATPPAPPSQPAPSGAPDFAIAGGWFFTQTGGGGGAGYAVTDEGGVRFWSEFQRLGGVQAVGYPASQRFRWDGFTVQVFQRVVFQWRPEANQAYFVNVFDRLHDLGRDDFLLRVRQTPPPRPFEDAGKPWDQVVQSHLAVLEPFPAIKAAYAGVVGDPIQANGLPVSDVTDMGNHYALRAQRVVFQQWKQDVPWASAGQVTVALGGDIAKETGVLPDPAALQPTNPPARAADAPPGNPRFGVAIGLADGDAAIANVLTRTGAGSWFAYGQPSAAGPGGRVQLATTGRNILPASADAVLQAIARERPGSHWIVGNEPNVQAQDFDPQRSLEENAAAYAAAFRRYRAAILAADPTARFVVGNTLNLDATCGGCPGIPTGRAFLDAFLRAYGEQIPADTIWGIHAYRIDWDQLPMTNTDEPIRELKAFRDYVDGLPGQRGKPIWLTEFGVVWGYPTLCAEGEKFSSCGAPLAVEEMARFLDTLFGWLRTDGRTLGIERWFLFTNFPPPEPFAAEPGGIALLDGSSAEAGLTRFGRLFAAQASQVG